jgi:hypothetical protein
MPDTIRKRALDCLIARLGEDNLFTWGTPSVNPGKLFYRKSELPALSVFAGDESALSEDYGEDKNQLQVEVSAAVLIPRANGSGEKESAYDLSEQIRGELIQACVTTDFQDLIDNINYTGGTINYPVEEDQALKISIMLLIEYKTKHNNPYE